MQRVFQVTNGRGVDVILDPIGGTYLARNIKVLATGGRLAVIGVQQGLKGELNLGRLLAKQGTVFATSLRTRSLNEKGAIVDDVCRNVWPKIDQGAVRPFIGQVFPINRAADAHRLMESGKHFGKILLQHEAASATSQLEITAGAIADASNEESK